MKEGLTHILWILDRSGSMGSVTDDVIGGFNRFIEDQKKIAGECNITLVAFDTYSQIIMEGNLQNVPPLSRFNYRPSGGTALIDAACRAIDDLGVKLAMRPESERPSRVIVVVQTDGEENSSRTYKNEDLRRRIEHQQAKYNWDFVFLGANIDSFSTAANYGFYAYNTANYTNTSAGLAGTYASASAAIAHSRTMDVALNMSVVKDENGNIPVAVDNVSIPTTQDSTKADTK